MQPSRPEQAPEVLRQQQLRQRPADEHDDRVVAEAFAVGRGRRVGAALGADEGVDAGIGLELRGARQPGEREDDGQREHQRRPPGRERHGAVQRAWVLQGASRLVGGPAGCADCRRTACRAAGGLVRERTPRAARPGGRRRRSTPRSRHHAARAAPAGSGRRRAPPPRPRRSHPNRGRGRGARHDPGRHHPRGDAALHRAVGVLDEHDALGAHQVVRTAGPSAAPRARAAGVANHVGVARLEPEHRRRLQAGVHAGQTQSSRAGADTITAVFNHWRKWSSTDPSARQGSRSATSS